jgi:ribosomal protein S12 methylthiotransferase
MLGLLKEEGVEITFEPDEAEICLVNTCSFIGEARQESVRNLVELADQGKELIIAGCLAQHYKEELLAEIPQARAVVGTGDIAKIADVVKAIAQDSSLRVVCVSDIPNDYHEEVLPRLKSGFGASAYLKIAEGCDHNCSFCIIPLLRGKFRSRTIESLVKEARLLVDGGVKEIILVSQDSTYYGLDIYGRMALPELLHALSEIDDLVWIRVMYSYPTEVNRHLLKTMASLPKVVKYVDIPLQHSHPEILSRMARPQAPEKTVALIREAIPEVALRSTFIVGFPGETQDHFEHLLRFVVASRFDRLGVFTYSRQMEVPSGHMKHQVPLKVKRQRRSQIMKAQHQIATESNRAMLGKEIDVLVESFDATRNLYCGRSAFDAPEIDNQVYVSDPSDGLVSVGDFVKVRIEEARPYDLYGTAIALSGQAPS